MKSVAVIGCTGSIGSQTIDVISRHKDIFDLQLITCNKNLAKAKEMASQLDHVQVGTHDNSQTSLFGQDLLIGDQAIIDWIISKKIRIVVVASSSIGTISFVLSILPYVERLALSSKEVIILAGSLQLIHPEWKEKIVPVDSEHVAIHQLLQYTNQEHIHRVILTASGGPFYSQTPVPDLTNMTPAAALKHPTWQMGEKVTIDSATLANKGIELLEAHYLFGFSPEKLNVVIHPQSMIHAMIQLKNGSVISQMAYPDMRLPIAYALFYPELPSLSYIRPIETDAFPDCSFIQTQATDIPIISLALECLHGSTLKPLFYLMADELAVEAFLNHKIRFTEVAGFLHFCVIELAKIYSIQNFQVHPAEVPNFIRDVMQNTRRMLIQFKKQVE
jgi:1-deoxy-D-xylulose-5-phosphate reductoisomerase